MVEHDGSRLNRATFVSIEPSSDSRNVATKRRCKGSRDARSFALSATCNSRSAVGRSLQCRSSTMTTTGPSTERRSSASPSSSLMWSPSASAVSGAARSATRTRTAPGVRRPACLGTIVQGATGAREKTRPPGAHTEARAPPCNVPSAPEKETPRQPRSDHGRARSFRCRPRRSRARPAAVLNGHPRVAPRAAFVRVGDRSTRESTDPWRHVNEAPPPVDRFMSGWHHCVPRADAAGHACARRATRPRSTNEGGGKWPCRCG